MKPTAFKVLALCAAAILCLASTTAALKISYPAAPCNPSSYNYKLCQIARQLCRDNPEECQDSRLLHHKLTLARRDVDSDSALRAANHRVLELITHKPSQAPEHYGPTTSPLMRSLGGRPTRRHRQRRTVDAGPSPRQLLNRKRRGFFDWLTNDDDDDDDEPESDSSPDVAESAATDADAAGPATDAGAAGPATDAGAAGPATDAGAAGPATDAGADETKTFTDGPVQSQPRHEPPGTFTGREDSTGSYSEDYDASAWGPPKGNQMPRNDDLKNVPYYASSPAPEEMPGISVSSESEIDTSDSHRPIEPKPFRDDPPKSLEEDSKASFAETPDYDASAWGPPTPSSPRHLDPFYASSPPDDDPPGRSLTVELQSDSEDAEHLDPFDSYRPTNENTEDYSGISASDYSRQVNNQKPFKDPAPDDSRDDESKPRKYKRPKKPPFLHKPPKNTDDSDDRFEGMAYSYEPQGDTRHMFQQAAAGLPIDRPRDHTASE